MANATTAPVTSVSDAPAFLRKQEPDAEFALRNNGRMDICKGDVELSLSPDDLRVMFSFLSTTLYREGA